MTKARKILILFCLCLSSRAFAQTPGDQHLINLSYWNWGEDLVLSRSDVSQASNSNFAAVGIEYEYFPASLTKGWNISAAALTGQATGGDTNGNLVYVASYQKFYGAAAKVNWFWRIERRIYLEMGPLVLFRSFSWPVSSDGISAESGPSTNYGAVLSLRVRLSPRLDFCQSFGSLIVKGRPLWSAGFGYRY